MNGFRFISRILIAILFLSSSNQVSAAFRTGADLYEGATDYTNNKESFAADYFMGYVVGTIDSYGIDLMVPANVTVGQMCFIVKKKYLTEHPEEWNKPAPSIISDAIHEAFQEGRGQRKSKKGS